MAISKHALLWSQLISQKVNTGIMHEQYSLSGITLCIWSLEVCTIYCQYPNFIYFLLHLFSLYSTTHVRYSLPIISLRVHHTSSSHTHMEEMSYAFNKNSSTKILVPTVCYRSSPVSQWHTYTYVFDTVQSHILKQTLHKWCLFVISLLTTQKLFLDAAFPHSGCTWMNWLSSQ
jgi:hypothetical protein